MPHYYSKKQTSDLNLREINIRIGNIFFQLFSGSGIFSKKKLDKGTEVLLKNLIVKNNWKVLDLGCGMGVVGIYVKKVFPKTNVVMSDVNKRAVYLTKKNANLNNLDVEVICSDGFEKIEESFDAILLNPPQVAGKEVCFKLIEDSFEHLNKSGLLELVARHNKGGKTLSEKMNSTFGNVKEIVKSSGYRVYISQKKT
ncbi:MAG: class I SAM-dependent methyltransferase [DPANN group archaeon]|nr:class I SAM-dependent methyltransferase [DPANN group archaeon]